MSSSCKVSLGQEENDLAGPIYYLMELSLKIPVIIHNEIERENLISCKCTVLTFTEKNANNILRMPFLFLAS